MVVVAYVPMKLPWSAAGTSEFVSEATRRHREVRRLDPLPGRDLVGGDEDVGAVTGAIDHEPGPEGAQYHQQQGERAERGPAVVGASREPAGGSAVGHESWTLSLGPPVVAANRTTGPCRHR